MPAVAPPDVPEFDTDAALERVITLMGIRGKSGEEQAIIDHLIAELRKAGVPAATIQQDDAHKRSSFPGEAGNLIVKLPGTVRAPRRLLMAHVDTVPLCVGCQPVRKGGLVRSADPTTALGADDRSGAAVLLTVAIELLKQKLPHPPLTLFWPIQEEVGLNGARYVSLSKLGNPKLCFNWDGNSAANACIGATGAYDLKIEVEGIASHAGVHPEGGVSAIAVAGIALADLHQNGWHGLIVKGRSSGTSNIGVVSGGEATNVVTPLVKLRGEVRSHDPKFRDRLVKEFRQAFERAARSVKNESGLHGKIHFSAELKYESFRLRDDDPSVEAATRAIRAIGLSPQTRISNGGLDANWLTVRGLPTVTLGAGQQDVHTVNETLNIEDFLNGCRVGLLLATGI